METQCHRYGNGRLGLIYLKKFDVMSLGFETNELRRQILTVIFSWKLKNQVDLAIYINLHELNLDLGLYKSIKAEKKRFAVFILFIELFVKSYFNIRSYFKIM